MSGLRQVMFAMLMERVLEVLGLSDLEEQSYLALLDSAGASASEVAVAVDMSEKSVRKALHSLERRGLVSRGAGRQSHFMPAPPDAAIEVLILRRQEELESARLFASQLLRRFQSIRETRSTELVEIIRGRNAVNQRFEQMQILAKGEVLICDRPPYASALEHDLQEGPRPVDNHTELACLAKGISYRSIYDTTALEIAGRTESIERLVDEGEQARSMSGLPMKLAIADRRVALLPLNISAPDAEVESVLVHRSSLLDALVTLFEALWERALPLAVPGSKQTSTPGVDHDVTPRDRSILSLLSAGLSDSAVARQLGVGERTVQRRMNLMMDRLQARTRFQAALLASSKGWIESD